MGAILIHWDGTCQPVAARVFTPGEANACLPRLRPLLAALRSAHHEALLAREQWQDAVQAGDAAEADRWRDLAAARAAEAARVVDGIEALGAELKDPILGLVDFPGRRRDGTPVLLCYRDDEAAIVAWHTRESGFAGRRPLAEL